MDSFKAGVPPPGGGGFLVELVSFFEWLAERDIRMQVALIGLAQSGKSTLFSAVTGGQVHAGAGSAHQTDKAVVKVPDDRVEKLAEIYQPKKLTHAVIEFIDLPGLSFVEEGHRHEARRIVAAARQAAMLVVVLRGFESDSVAKYRDRVDPAKDLDELNNELMLADLEMIENRIGKLRVSITKPSPHVEQDKRELAILERCQAATEELQPLSEVIRNPEEEKLLRSFGFLSMKPVLVVVNVGEDAVGEEVKLAGEAGAGEVMSLSAQLEAELAALEEQERAEFMEDLGVKEIARDRLVKKCYEQLNLISFLTYGADEVRAWTIPSGCPAVEAAGQIHSDIQRGFIRAETVHWEDFIAAGDMKAAKAAGKVRLEGKTYAVQDGDMITFRFNV